jgi:hypothetical protein
MTPYELPTERRCTGCSEWKPLSEFPLNSRMHLGVSSRCRECHRAATKDWRSRHPDYDRAYYDAHRRVGSRVSRCVVCGETFKQGRAGPLSLRCRPCRRERKLEQRRVLNRR